MPVLRAALKELVMKRYTLCKYMHLAPHSPCFFSPLSPPLLLLLSIMPTLTNSNAIQESFKLLALHPIVSDYDDPFALLDLS